ncbi:G-type lectin S-receptor-like serine/threonine-protein kinase [Tanacetum coccineum]|uniref:G-type lectin S-receptor-like serine/threonine-protein kinase n=1 Tax=Tanacetum coccineum TaxID=301880 RepID=A0ABQ5I209_9ASTR
MSGSCPTMTSWESDDDPTPGNFVVGLSAERPPQIFTWNGSKPHWRGGPWDGGKFIRVAEQILGYSELITLVPDNSQGGGYLTINLFSSSDFRWLYLQPDGVFQMIYMDISILNSLESSKEIIREVVDDAWTEDLIEYRAFSFGGEIFTYDLSHSESGRNTKLNHFSSDDEIVSTDTLQVEVLPRESLELPIYEFKQVITATDNFSYRNKLGEGGFGPVYKGMLDDGQQIAVKRLSGESGQGIEEFKNEIALISKLQHRNLVKLLGCCIEGKERLLIYEDLKCSNILLDEKMNPKISDFGLARNFQMTQELANTRRIVGTYGKKNTEIIHHEQVYPLAHAWKSWKEGRGDQFIDQALAKPSCLPEGLRCLHVGLLCVQDLAKDRPTMTEVVSMLCSEIDLPEPKEPLFTLQRLSGSSIGQESPNTCSINALSISMVEGR